MPVTQTHPRPRSQSLPKRQGDGHALSPVPLGPSLPKRSPGWGWTDPQVTARALPWRVLRVICPPIAGSGEHGHLRLAGWPRHRAALAASSPPPARPPPPPWPAAAGMAGPSPPLLHPPTHTAPCPQDRPHTHAHPSGPAQSRFPAPTHSRSLPHLPALVQAMGSVMFIYIRRRRLEAS